MGERKKKMDTERAAESYRHTRSERKREEEKETQTTLLYTETQHKRQNWQEAHTEAERRISVRGRRQGREGREKGGQNNRQVCWYTPHPNLSMSSSPKLGKSLLRALIWSPWLTYPHLSPK